MEKSVFLEHFCELLELDNGFLTGDEQLASLESWDSLSVLGFIAFADQQCGKIIEPTDITSAQTVEDLRELLDDKST